MRTIFSVVIRRTAVRLRVWGDSSWTRSWRLMGYAWSSRGVGVCCLPRGESMNERVGARGSHAVNDGLQHTYSLSV